jgi:hypothetical protein
MESAEQRQHFGVPQERIRPAMQPDDGCRTLVRRPFVNLMKGKVRYPYAFVREAAESRLLRTPVETGPPVIDKLAEVIGISSSPPSLALDDGRPSRSLQSRPKIN